MGGYRVLKPVSFVNAKGAAVSYHTAGTVVEDIPAEAAAQLVAARRLEPIGIDGYTGTRVDGLITVVEAEPPEPPKRRRAAGGE